jgi:hypothetical protein
VLFANDDNILGENINTVKKNTEALLSISKDDGLEGNSEKTKYASVSRYQNAGQNNNFVIANKSKLWQS